MEASAFNKKQEPFFEISVNMKPSTENKYKPYFWIIYEGEADPVNAGCGWAETTDKAWEDANKYLEGILSRR